MEFRQKIHNIISKMYNIDDTEFLVKDFYIEVYNNLNSIHEESNSIMADLSLIPNTFQCELIGKNGYYIKFNHMKDTNKSKVYKSETVSNDSIIFKRDSIFNLNIINLDDTEILSQLGFFNLGHNSISDIHEELCPSIGTITLSPPGIIRLYDELNCSICSVITEIHLISTREDV